jgi:dihydropteroate synthase
MGVVNVTPDSFFDRGKYFASNMAVERALELIDQGANIIDIGGESTRPGSEGVSSDEELNRVLPVLKSLAGQTDIPLSVDTVKPEVARAVLDAGAQMINDVSCLRNSPDLARLAAAYQAQIVLMHSRKTPRDMQEDVAYEDVVREVCQELRQAVSRAEAEGVPQDAIWVDPGIGFAKTAEQCLELIARLPEIVELGYPVLVGPSRKSFIGEFTGAAVDERLGGTAAAITAAVLGGAAAVRVHDVEVMAQAAQIAQLIGVRQARPGGDGDD